jgi:hypothetical protein
MFNVSTFEIATRDIDRYSIDIGVAGSPKALRRSWCQAVALATPGKEGSVIQRARRFSPRCDAAGLVAGGLGRVSSRDLPSDALVAPQGRR